MKTTLWKIAAPLLVGLSVFGIDQLTKHWASTVLADQSSPYVAILDGVLSFNYTLNHGAAFGVLEGSGVLFALIAIAVVAVILASIIWFPARRLVTLCSLGLQLGGAMGNLADRVRLGYVVDFIYIRPFPVFNIADAAIVSGACLLAWVWLHPSGTLQYNGG
jgi:signal peptidase II